MVNYWSQHCTHIHTELSISQFRSGKFECFCLEWLFRESFRISRSESTDLESKNCRCSGVECRRDRPFRTETSDADLSTSLESRDRLQIPAKKHFTNITFSSVFGYH